MKIKLIILTACIFWTSYQAIGATPDTTFGDRPRNVIKYNFTAPLLWGFSNVIIGYERAIKTNRSFSFSLGYRTLPQLTKERESSVFDTRNHSTKNGISFNTDFRFYIKSRAISPAPDGFYIAPFFNFYHIDIINDLVLYDNEVITNEARIDSYITTYGIGCKVGYQVHLGKNFFVDMVFLGPSYTFYNAGATIDAKIEAQDDSEIAEIIGDLITNLFPGMDKLLDTKQYDTKGGVNTSALGFHYSVTIGYAF